MRAALFLPVLLALLMILPANVASASTPEPTSAPRHLTPDTTPGWTTICNGCTDNNTPTGESLVGREYGAMAYDTEDGYAVLFGGMMTATGNLDGATWAYGGGVWHLLATQLGSGTCMYYAPSPKAGQTAACPSPREGDAMAYDPVMGGIVLDGGTSWSGYPFELAEQAAINGPTADNTDYDPVPLDGTIWEFTNGAWLAMSQGAPYQTAFESITYDPSLGGVVIGGGIGNLNDNSGCYGGGRFSQNGFSTLYVLNSTSKQWVSINSDTNGAPGNTMYGSVMAFDPQTNELVLEGGGHINTIPGGELKSCKLSTDYYGDTWTWKGGNPGGWTDMQTSPGSNNNNVLGTMVYDKSSGQTLLIGGSAPGAMNWVDEWSGSAWIDTSTSGGPGDAGVQEGSSAAYDAADSYVVLVPGTTGANSVTLAWPPPFTASVSSYVTKVDAGHPFSAKVSVSGPLAEVAGWAYILNWTENGAWAGTCANGWTNPNGPNQTTASCPAPSTQGTYNLLLTANIGNGEPALALQSTQVQGANSVTVYPSLSVSLSPSLNPAWVEAGDTIYLNASANGGEQPYTYSWTNLSCSNVNGNPGSANVGCIATIPGEYHVTVTVSDPTGASAAAATNMTVYAPLAVSHPDWANQDIDSGALTMINATIAGGYPDPSSRVYNWSGLPTGCANGNTALITCQPVAVSSPYHTNICFNVSAPSGTAGVCGYATVEPPLKVISYVSNRSSVDGNQWVGFAITVSGGTGSYSSTSWSVSDVSTGKTLSCLPSSYVNASLQSSISTGCQAPNALSNQTLSASVTVADGSLNGVKANSLSMPIYPDPYITQSNATAYTVYSNKTVVLFGAAAMGTGIYSYAWSGLPPGCTSQNVSVLACTPNVTIWQHVYYSLFNIYLWVNDSNGYGASWPSGPDSKSIVHPIVLTVRKDPFLFINNRPGADVSQPVSFQLVYNRAYGTLTGVTWLGLPPSSPACVNSFNQYSGWANCTMSTVGSYQVTAQVTEQSGSNTTYGWLNVSTDPVIGTLTVPSMQTIGQTATFTLSGAAGGLYPYGFNWTLSAIGCSNQVTGNHTLVASCVPTVSGTQTVSVVAIDGNGWHSNIASAFVTFGTLPTVSITPNPALTDSGLNTLFTSSVSGGSFNYQWTVTPTASCTPPGNAQFQNCSWSQPGTYVVNLTLSNSAGYVTSTTINYNVASDPTAYLKESRTYLDLGQSVKFTTVAAGGLAPYNFTWLGLPYGCSQANQSVIACTPTSSGNFSVSAGVHDTLGRGSATNFVNLTVVGGPAISTPVATRASIDNGQSVNFTVFVTNSSGGDSYSWSGLPSSCPSSPTSTISCSYLLAGTYHVAATVTDSNGQSALSPALQYVVISAPSVKLSGPVGSVDALQQVLFTGIAVNGSGIYHYIWGATSPFSCSAVDSPKDVCIASSAGTGAVTISVTDSNGGSTMAALTVTVNPALVVNATITSGSTTIPLNQTSYQSGYLLTVQAGTTFSVSGTAAGGAPPYVLSVTVNGTSIGKGVNQTSFTASSVLPSVGVFPISFSVADSVTTVAIQGAVQSAGIPMNVTLNAPLVTNASVPVNLSVTVTGGVGPFTYLWSAQDGTFGTTQNNTSTTTPYVTVQWSRPGQYNVSVTVVDGQKLRAYSQTVVAVGNSPMTVTWTAHSPIDQNAAENVSVTVTGGTAPYAYHWYEQNAPGGGHWTSTLPYSNLDWPTTGTFNASVTVVDAHGASGIVSGVFVVGTGISVACSPVESGSLTVGNAVTFSLPCTPHGGIPPYTYNWELISGSDPGVTPFANGTGITFTHTFQSAGNYLVTVWIQDSTHVGGAQTQPGSFHVASSTLGGGLGSLTSSPLFWIVLLPIVALALFLLLAFLFIRRKKQSLSSRQQTGAPETVGADLSPLQWAILEHLDTHPLEEQEKLTMSVGTAQGIAPGDVLSAVGILGPMGLLDSRQNVEDKETRYELTESGKKLLAKHRTSISPEASEVVIDTAALSGAAATAPSSETSTPDTDASAPWHEERKDHSKSQAQPEAATPSGHKPLGEKRQTVEEANPYKGLVKPEDVNPQLAGKESLPAELLQPLELQQVKDRGTVERTSPGKSVIDYDAKARELEEKTKGNPSPAPVKPKKAALRDYMHRPNKGDKDE